MTQHNKEDGFSANALDIVTYNNFEVDYTETQNKLNTATTQAEARGAAKERKRWLEGCVCRSCGNDMDEDYVLADTCAKCFKEM